MAQGATEATPAAVRPRPARVRGGAGPLVGRVRIPGDKSISHRAVMFGSLAEGTTRVRNFLPGEDCLSTVRCFRALGVEIALPENPEEGEVAVRGGGVEALAEPSDVLDCGNSGTTMRLVMGILAGRPFFSVLTGDASLRRRPMARVAEPLRRMGARIDGRRGGDLAPLSVRGGDLRPGEFVLPVASAQLKSALILAGLAAPGRTVVTEPFRSRDHTERMLRHFGVPVAVDGPTVTVEGPARLRAAAVTVPGDISAAAFFLVAGSIVPGSRLLLPGVGVNPTRAGILEVLEAMGAEVRLLNVREEGGEPVADLEVAPAELRGVRIGGEIIPRLIDEVPVLAVAAAFARGVTEIRDAGELRVKESDRIAAVARELGRLGAAVEELPDGLRITGGRPLRGAECQTCGDHRLAMALAVAGLGAAGETVIDDAACAAVSFPRFWDELRALGAAVSAGADSSSMDV